MGLVFVSMMLGNKNLDKVYHEVIEEVIEKFGHQALRIDEIQTSGLIINDIQDGIAKCDIFLADLTGERPNCYYETGIAHALGKPVILTIRRRNKIHFDLAGYRFIQWTKPDGLRRELRKRFKQLAQAPLF